MSFIPTGHSNFRFYRFFLALGFLLVAYMMYVLTASVYNSYMLDRHIEKFKQKNAQIALEYESNLEDLKYFQSEAYAEKIAKEQLGLVNRNEEVIVMLKNDIASQSELQKNETSALLEYRRLKNPQKWWYYFFN